MSDSEFFDRSVRKLDEGEADNLITAEDRRIIERFILERDAEGISPTRHHKLVSALVNMRAYHPPYTECTFEDLLAAFNKIKYARRKPRKNEKTSGKEQPMTTQNTIADRQRILKSFFMWLCENGINTKIDENKVRKLKTASTDFNTVHIADLPTEEELEAFFKNCMNTRDRALYSVLFEGALRVGDVGNLQFKDLQITDTYCRIRTCGKTGVERVIPLLSSRAYLIKWLNEYPKPHPTPEDFVFLAAKTNKPMTYASISLQMRKIAKRAGIQKNIHPHLFRHTKITMLSRSGLPEQMIKQLAWGNVGTNMMRVYYHPTVDDLEGSLADVQGIAIPGREKDGKKPRSILKPVQCPKCGFINPPGEMFCGQCMKPLTAEAEDELTRFSRLIFEKVKANPAAFAEMFK